MADMLQMLLGRLPPEASESSMQLVLSLLQEHRKAKEAESSKLEEERKVKELELAIVKEKTALVQAETAKVTAEATLEATKQQRHGSECASQDGITNSVSFSMTGPPSNYGESTAMNSFQSPTSAAISMMEQTQQQRGLTPQTSQHDLYFMNASPLPDPPPPSASTVPYSQPQSLEDLFASTPSNISYQMQPPMPQQHHHQQQPMHQLHVLPDIYQPTRFTSSLFPEFETALSPSTPPVDVDPYGSFRAAVSNPSSIPEEDMSFLDAWPERGFAEHLKSVYNSQAPSGADGAEDSNHFIENDNGDAREDSPTVASGSGTQPAAASEKPSSTFMPINSSAVPIPPTNNRKRRKRDMREVDALCTNCSRRVARLFLHGTEDQFLDPYVVQMKCVVCPSATEDGQASTPIEPTPPATAPTSRKRKAACLAPETRPVNCEVCKRQAAVGGIWRSTDLSANGGADSAKRQATNGKPAEPVGICRLNPPFGVEVVCAPCHEKYTLCSDCGGGGKYRTGKWRPSQLFAANRLTCSLSHERYGAQSSLHTEQWSVVRPGETAVPPTMDPQISPEMISVILEACEDIVLSHSAVAKVMERCPNRSTWEGLQRIVAHLRKNIDEMLNGEDKDLRPGIRRYVNLRWISPKHETSTSDSGSPPCKGWTDCSGRRVIFTVMIGDWNTTTGNMSNFLGVACSGKHRGEAWALMLNSIKADHARMTAEGFNPPPLGWICLNVSCGGRNGQMDTEVAKTLRKQGFLPLPEAPEAAGIATCEDEETTEVVGNFQIWAGRFETILTNSHLV